MKRGEDEETRRPHIVCVPFGAQGHITPMLSLAKLLHSKAGFHISFVNTHENHQRLLKSGALPFTCAEATTNSFRFFSIPDGLPPPSSNSSDDGFQRILTFLSSINSTIHQPFMDLLNSGSLVEPSSSSSSSNNENHRHQDQDQYYTPPPVSLILSDVAFVFTLDVSKETGIPLALLWTASACSLLGYAQLQRLKDLGVIPFHHQAGTTDSSHSANGLLDRDLSDWIPSMAGNGMPLKSLPSFNSAAYLGKTMMIDMFIRRVDFISNSSAPLILHTFDALEHHTIHSLSTYFPNSPIFPIGPLHLLLDHHNHHHDHSDEGHKNLMSSFRSNLREEDSGCIAWLDSKPAQSVIYVNFGSVAMLTPTEIEEIAWGLANSNKNFLWIIRPDIVVGDQGKSSILSPEFKAEIQGRGSIQSWCDQQRVLGHPSVAGFLTHCGWNSTIESLSSGVPLICSPHFADQITNCWFSCTKWGVGVEIDGYGLKRGDVERLVRQVVDGDKGRTMRDKAREWKRLALEAATSPYGSSHFNFDAFVNRFLR